MSNSGPRRLKDDAQASPLLTGALDALCEREADAARVERLSMRLDALLNAPPAPASGGRAGPASPGKAWTFTRVSLKLVVGALVGLAPGLWLAGERARVPAAVSGSAAPSAAAAPPSVNVAQAAAIEPARPREAQARERVLPAGEPLVRPPARAATSSPVARPRPPIQKTALAAPGPAPATSGPPAARAEAPSPQPAAPLAPEPQPLAAKELAPVQPVEPARPGELELLLSARKVLPRDAAHALRLLEQHAERYPHGLLTPEREVLAIEALQHLGRASEADQRRARFEQRYPGSFHVRKPAR